eukprot:tig00000944_g5929.t1
MRSEAPLLAALFFAVLAASSAQTLSVASYPANGTSPLLVFFVDSTGPADAPLLISLPSQDRGCSSLRHALHESGPFVFDGGGALVENGSPWSSLFALAYVERPAGDAAPVDAARVTLVARAIASEQRHSGRDVYLLGHHGAARLLVGVASGLQGALGRRVRGAVAARGQLDVLREANATLGFLNANGVLDRWDLAELRADLALASAARLKGDLAAAREGHAALRRRIAAKHGGLALGANAGALAVQVRGGVRAGPGAAATGPAQCAEGADGDVQWDAEALGEPQGGASLQPLAAAGLLVYAYGPPRSAPPAPPAGATGRRGQWDWGAPPATLEALLDLRACAGRPSRGAGSGAGQGAEGGAGGGGRRVGSLKEAGPARAALFMEASGFPSRERAAPPAPPAPPAPSARTQRDARSYPQAALDLLRRLVQAPRAPAALHTRSRPSSHQPPAPSPAGSADSSPSLRGPLRPSFLLPHRRLARPARPEPPRGRFAGAGRGRGQPRRALAQAATCVNNLPGLPPELAGVYGAGCRMRTGYLTASIASRPDLLSSLFYWFIESRHPDPSSPLLIWLNGGPGCSSLFGLLHENGPFQVASDGSLRASATGWNQHNGVVYIDQPVHTGFSQAAGNSFVRTSEEAGELLYESLQQLYDGSPELRDRPLFIAGESYAGHYIPAFAAYIIAGNAAGRRRVPLEGIAIGNAWIDAGPQMEGYVNMYYSLGFLDGRERDELLERERRVVQLCARGDAHGCSQATDSLMAGISGAAAQSYDIDDLRNEREPRDALAGYLNRPDVLRALQAPAARPWAECDDPPFYPLYDDQSRPLSPLLDRVLRAGVRTLLYSGNFDGNVPAATEENVLHALTAPAAAALRAAPGGSRPWRLDGRTVGWVRGGSGLDWVRVFGAGHMVPTDEPAVALELIERFLWRADYTDGPSGRAYDAAARAKGPVVAAPAGGFPRWAAALVGVVAGLAALAVAVAVALIVRRRRVAAAARAAGAFTFSVFGEEGEALRGRELGELPTAGAFDASKLEYALDDDDEEAALTRL